MHTFILPSTVNDHDEDTVGRRMNVAFMDMITNSSFCDCQSHAIRDYFGELYTQARFSIANTFEKYRTGMATQIRPSKKFMQHMEGTPYMDVMDERAEVPEGLSVTYLEYLNVLVPAQERASEVLTNVIRPFTKYVAKLITDEKVRNGVRHSIREFTDLEKDHEKFEREFGECFAKNSYGPTQPFSAVVKRQADWQLVFKKTEELKKHYDKYDQKAITSALNDLYASVGELMKLVNAEGFAGVDRDLTKQLASGMYSVAREIEFSAHTTYRTVTFINCVNATVETAEKKFKL